MKIDARNKGKMFERRVANAMKAAGLSARRGLTQSGGAIEPDVVVDGAEVWIECKHRRRVDIAAAIAQAEHDAGRANNAGTIVIVGRDTGGDIFAAVTSQLITGKPLTGGFDLAGKRLAGVVEYKRWRARVPQLPVGKTLLVVNPRGRAFYLMWFETLLQVWR